MAGGAAHELNQTGGAAQKPSYPRLKSPPEKPLAGLSLPAAGSPRPSNPHRLGAGIAANRSARHLIPSGYGGFQAFPKKFRESSESRLVTVVIKLRWPLALRACTSAVYPPGRRWAVATMGSVMPVGRTNCSTRNCSCSASRPGVADKGYRQCLPIHQSASADYPGPRADEIRVRPIVLTCFIPAYMPPTWGMVTWSTMVKKSLRKVV